MKKDFHTSPASCVGKTATFLSEQVDGFEVSQAQVADIAGVSHRSVPERMVKALESGVFGKRRAKDGTVFYSLASGVVVERADDLAVRTVSIRLDGSAIKVRQSITKAADRPIGRIPGPPSVFHLAGAIR